MWNPKTLSSRILTFFILGVGIALTLDKVIGLESTTKTLIIVGGFLAPIVPVILDRLDKDGDKARQEKENLQRDFNELENHIIRLGAMTEASNTSDIMESIRKIERRVHHLEKCVKSEHLP
jgi:hypothetical protein